jgi:hypothetical protein
MVNGLPILAGGEALPVPVFGVDGISFRGTGDEAGI